MHPIPAISRACRITDRIMGKVPRYVHRCETEKELAAFLEGEMKKAGVKRAFRTIVASGRNTSEIHHYPTTDSIVHGFLMLDFGVVYKGYRSDLSRTLYVGKPSSRERGHYQRVKKAQVESIKTVRAGVYAREVDSTARKSLGRYKKYFRHALGHGLGKKVHQAPYLRPKSNRILREGMVITIEPGIYFKGKWGIRIEDDLLVTRTGYRMLTHSPRNLQILKP